MLSLVSSSSARLYTVAIRNRGSARRLLSIVRSLVVKLIDPVIEMPIRGFRLTMNLSHALPFYVHDHPEYDTAVVRLAESVARYRGLCVVIDVGANIGDTARAILEVQNTKVLCIEGNQVFGRFIPVNLAGFKGRYFHLPAFVGDPNESLRAHLVAGGGTARLRKSLDAPIVHTVSLSAAISRSELPAPDLLKVDTDGFDTKILKQAVDVLSAHHPVLFFEFDPRLFQHVDPDGGEIIRHLAQLGYQCGLAYANTGQMLGMFSGPKDFKPYADWTSIATDRYLDVCLFANRKEFESFYESELRYKGEQKESARRS